MTSRLVKFVQGQEPGRLSKHQVAVVGLELFAATPWLPVKPGQKLHIVVNHANIMTDKQGVWRHDKNGSQSGINFPEPASMRDAWPTNASHGTLVELEIKYGDQHDAEAVPFRRFPTRNMSEVIEGPPQAFYRLRIADTGSADLHPDGVMMSLSAVDARKG